MKFKIDFADIPDKIFKDIDGVKHLVLEVPSLQGRKRFCLKNGDEVEATDKLMELALEAYELPKIPIVFLKKDKKDKKDKKSNDKGKTSTVHAFYHESEVRGKKPFSKVTNNG